MKHISKNVFLNAVACPTIGWLLRSDEPEQEATTEELSLAEQFRIDQGIEIGNRARRLYPSGVLASGSSLEACAKYTERLMKDAKTSIIFEGTFLVGDYAAKADILVKEKEGWHLIEVKSSVNDNPELLDDLAYTFMVIARSGVKISRASLLLVSKDYRLGMADKSLFTEIDHSDDGEKRALEFDEYWDQVRNVTSGPRPKSGVIFQCKDCSQIDDCMGEHIVNPVFDLPRLSQKKFDGLQAMGIMKIEDVPDDFELTANQSKVRECVIAGKPWKSEHLVNDLGDVAWPAFYLDFETVMTPTPLYPDIAPYTQIPTQYSIHKCNGLGLGIEHREYLSDHSKDSREELAKNLITDLEKHGSIITYSSFEKTTINNLIKVFPKLSATLQPLIDRMVDLESILRKGYYHPDFHGRTSIKVVLPVVVPELSYKGLEIASGDCAIAAFAYMALGKIKGKQADAVKENLLKYCAQDTMAMVRLHERLCE